jgi:hypothetical protein
MRFPLGEVDADTGNIAIELRAVDAFELKTMDMVVDLALQLIISTAFLHYVRWL